MENTRYNYRLIPLFAVLIITVGQMSIDIYLPSLPYLTQHWQTSGFMMQLTLTVFTLGYSVSQLFYGPISDRIGRRGILLSGLIIYLIGTLICMLANGPYSLILGRLIQGIGIGSSQVVGRAITRDRYSGADLIRVMSYVSMSIALSPAIAPSLGGFIHDTIGWHGSFVFLFIYVTILWFIFLRYLPETLKTPLTHKNYLQSTLYHYKCIITHPVFAINGLLVILTFTGFISFQTMGPFILQDLLGYSASAYGALIIFVVIGFALGTIINNPLMRYFSDINIIRAGALSLFIGASSMMLIGLWGFINIYVILIPMALYSFGAGLINPIVMASMLSPFPKIAGTAGAAMGATLMLGATIWSLIAASLPETSQVALASILLFNSLLFPLFLKARPKTTLVTP